MISEELIRIRVNVTLTYRLTKECSRDWKNIAELLWVGGAAYGRRWCCNESQHCLLHLPNQSDIESIHCSFLKITQKQWRNESAENTQWTINNVCLRNPDSFYHLNHPAPKNVSTCLCDGQSIVFYCKWI